MSTVDHRYGQVETYLKSQIGDPIIKSISMESNAIQDAINLALTPYWLAFPYTWRTYYQSNGKGSVVDTFDNITNNAFMNNPNAKIAAHFLGVTRIEDGALGAIGNNIDSYLLGVPYPNPSYKVYPGSLDLAEIVRYRTEVSIITGEIEVEYDHVNKKVTFLTPNAFGQFHVFYAFSFDESAGLSYIPNQMIDLFRKMCAVSFLDMIINARGNIVVNSDFRVDLSQLAKKRDFLQERVDQEIKSAQISTVMWG